MLHKEVSQNLGIVWKKMTHSEKMPYFIEAERERLKHKLKYPYYRYQPKKKHKKISKTKSKNKDLFKINLKKNRNIQLEEHHGFNTPKTNCQFLSNYPVKINAKCGNRSFTSTFYKQNFCKTSKGLSKNIFLTKEEKFKRIAFQFDYNNYPNVSQKLLESNSGVELTQAMNLSLKN